MEIAYFIGFCFIGYWIYFSINKEGLLWIPRAIVNVGSFVLWIYSTFTIYSKFGVGLLQVLASVGIIIGLVLIALSVNDKLDELSGELLKKNPYDKNE